MLIFRLQGFCFVMVFASLLEYAAVSYLNKKLAQRRKRMEEKRKKKAEEEQVFWLPSTRLCILMLQ